jgi:hypothetical protein
LANFVGIVIGFLNVLKYTPHRLLHAASLSFECEKVLNLRLLIAESLCLSTIKCNESPVTEAKRAVTGWTNYPRSEATWDHTSYFEIPSRDQISEMA